ncbi:hypothetical protein [Spirosoma sp.]|uniref:hypothetical protein n=1 Tax=Spirosoma sp. TaxID=1899569 RepID=UPI00262B4AEB|nr:hypothetical protein [Spirosoma sp.]MCX6216593.1 hypothetical protein [Spirosoma sp.]
MKNNTIKNSKSSRKWILYSIGVVMFLYVLGNLFASNDPKPLKPVLALEHIANHSIEEVQKEVGKGEFKLNWKDKKAGCLTCPKYTYKDDSLEVIYIDGKADRITLNHLQAYPFNDYFITALGLPYKEADFKNESVIRWYNYQGFKEIMTFNDGNGQVHYGLIKTHAD